MLIKKKKCQRGGASAPKQPKRKTQKEIRTNRVDSISSTTPKKTPTNLSQKYKKFRAWARRGKTKTALDLQGKTFRNKHSFFGYGKTIYNPSDTRKSYNLYKKAKSDLAPSRWEGFKKAITNKNRISRAWASISDPFRFKSSVNKTQKAKAIADKKQGFQNAFNTAKQNLATKLSIDASKIGISTKNKNIVNMAAKSAADKIRQNYNTQITKNKNYTLNDTNAKKLRKLEKTEQWSNAYKTGEQDI